MSITKCSHWLGHRFEARYSYGAPTIANFKGDPIGVLELIERSKVRTYERDICIHCGVTIERPAPTPAAGG